MECIESAQQRDPRAVLRSPLPPFYCRAAADKQHQPQQGTLGIGVDLYKHIVYSHVDTSYLQAIRSFKSDPDASVVNEGWDQGVMVAALLGQTGKAMSFVSGRANSHPAAGYRFPGFAQPFEDSEPSADQYSNMMQVQASAHQVIHTCLLS